MGQDGSSLRVTLGRGAALRTAGPHLRARASRCSSRRRTRLCSLPAGTSHCNRRLFKETSELGKKTHSAQRSPGISTVTTGSSGSADNERGTMPRLFTLPSIRDFFEPPHRPVAAQDQRRRLEWYLEPSSVMSYTSRSAPYGARGRPFRVLCQIGKPCCCDSGRSFEFEACSTFPPCAMDVTQRDGASSQTSAPPSDHRDRGNAAPVQCGGLRPHFGAHSRANCCASAI